MTVTLHVTNDRYDQLADEVNGLSVGKAQGVILKRLEECHEKENIMSKMQGAETSDIAEQNQVLLDIDCDRIMFCQKSSQTLPFGLNTRTSIQSRFFRAKIRIMILFTCFVFPRF